MTKKYKYNKKNCNCSVREIIIDIYERKIILSGHHAFEWTISIISNTTEVQYIFPNRISARKEFSKYKRKK